MLSVTARYSENSTFNISWFTNATGTWSEFATNNTCVNGTYYQIWDWANISNCTYFWNVSVYDNDTYFNASYSFTTDLYAYNTQAEYWSFIYSPTFSQTSEYPPNESTDISRSPDNISCYISGNTVNVTVSFYNMTPVVDVWVEASNFTDITNSRISI